MRYVVVNTETREIVTSYYGQCMSHTVLPPVTVKRIKMIETPYLNKCISNTEEPPVLTRMVKEIVHGKPVYESVERPHFLTAFANTADYTHVLVPPEYETVNTDDLVMNGEAVTVTVAYLESVKNDKWNVIRKERNALLTATDWTMLRDVPHSLVWEEYRQLLRDLPSSFEKADDVVYPSPP